MIQLRAIYLSNEDVDIALFNGVVVKNRFNSIVRAA